MQIDAAINFAFGILSSAALLALVSLGLALIFGMIGVINFAHGEFIMLGGFLTITYFGLGIPLAVAMLAASLSVGAFGLLVERLLIRRLYGRLEATMLATFGLSLILTQVALLVWGNATPGIPTPFGAVRIGDYSISVYRIILIAAAIALLIGVWVIMTKTRFGVVARAASLDSEMAAAVGVDSRRVNMNTFALGSALAGAAGALISPIVAVAPTLGVIYVPQAFMTVVVGGAGVITGTSTASALLGTVAHSASSVAGSVVGVAALLATAIVLIRILPAGISGRLRRDL